MTVWSLVLAVHILAMAAWAGGMAYALLVLRPEPVGPVAGRTAWRCTGRPSAASS